VRRRAWLLGTASLLSAPTLRAQTNWRDVAVPSYTPPAFVDGALKFWYVPHAEAFAGAAMHLAETLEEWELLASHSGPLVERLTALRAWHPQAIPRGIAPYDYLQMLSAAHRVLVVHGNYLGAPERELLANNRDHMSLVYCPRSHAYFGHAAYPLAQALAAGLMTPPLMRLFPQMTWRLHIHECGYDCPVCAVLK